MRVVCCCASPISTRVPALIKALVDKFAQQSKMSDLVWFGRWLTEHPATSGIASAIKLHNDSSPETKMESSLRDSHISATTMSFSLQNGIISLVMKAYAPRHRM